MKSYKIITLIIVVLVFYFFKEPILQKIKPFTSKIPLTEDAQKLIGLNQTDLSKSVSKNKNPKEVLLPGPLEKIIAGDSKSTDELLYKKIIEYTNIERTKNNLKPLREKGLLNSSSLFKAYDMNTNQYFEHESPAGVTITDLASQFGYEYITIGENLAMGNFKTEDEIVTAWMNSPGHRANILNPKYTEIGVGLIPGTWQGRRVWYAVQHFGKPLSDCPAVDKTIKSIIDKNQTEISKIKTNLDTQKNEIEKAGTLSQNYEILVKTYNNLVSKYNSLINETKSKIDIYNAQVKAFNSCSQ